MMEFLEQNRLIYPLQTGFQRSTQTTLLKLTEDIRTGNDNKIYLTLLLISDFSKAFDKVSYTHPARPVTRNEKAGRLQGCTYMI